MKLLSLKYLILISFSLVLCAACRKHSFSEYEIKNNSDAIIKVTYKIANGTSSEQTILIGTGETTELYSEDLGVGRLDGSGKSGGNIGVFNKVEVSKNYVLSTKRDFLKTSSWHYDELNPHRAVYTLTVTNLDF